MDSHANKSLQGDAAFEKFVLYYKKLREEELQEKILLDFAGTGPLSKKRKNKILRSEKYLEVLNKAKEVDSELVNIRNGLGYCCPGIVSKFAPFADDLSMIVASSPNIRPTKMMKRCKNMRLAKLEETFRKIVDSHITEIIEYYTTKCSDFIRFSAVNVDIDQNTCARAYNNNVNLANLDPDNIDEIIAFCSGRWYESQYFNNFETVIDIIRDESPGYIDALDFYDYLIEHESEWFCDFARECETCDCDFPEFLYRIDWYEIFLDDVMPGIEDVSSSSHLTRLFEQNPQYRKLRDAYIGYVKQVEEKERLALEEERQMQKILLDRIPDTYPELYPETRFMRRKFILHVGPTNSGKTHNAIKALESAETGVYLAPLRLLAYEQFERMNQDGIPCSLVTGEEQILNENAKHQSSTIEMADLTCLYDVAVIDEAQMISDEFRGGFWTAAILGLCATKIHICLAPHAVEIIVKLIESCGDTYEINQYERLTELVCDASNYNFPKGTRKGDALIVFSRRDVHAVAAELQKAKYKCSIIYGALPYDVRHDEARKFSEGETDVIVATDAIGMGMNLPIKRVVFLQQQKFDGKVRRTLWAEEIQQIAGRAGRKGIFDQGEVNSLGNKRIISAALEYDVPQITSAYINFPEHLLDIDMPVSELLRHWKKIEPLTGYLKADTDRELSLALQLELITDNKKLIHQAITIPFNEKDSILNDLWYNSIRSIVAGKELPFEVPEPLNEITNESALGYAESLYRKMDLYFQLCKRFGDGKHISEIAEIKRDISLKIIGFLSKQKLKGKTCKYCGKQLSWLYPYGMCNECHDAIYGEPDWMYW